MIVTCASCLTKFHLDDSRISAKGAKVRCSRCQHIFFIIPPSGTKEEINEDFESFAHYHEALIEPSQKEGDIPLSVKANKKGIDAEQEEEIFSFDKKTPTEKAEQRVPIESVGEERVEVGTSIPKRRVQRERKSFSLFFALSVILVLLVFGVFTLWTEMGSDGKLSSYAEYPIQKITHLWSQISGTEKGGLIVEDLIGYEEQIEEIPLFIIEGKVKNQSQFAKKHIKIRVVIFDQNKDKVAEKEIVCGRIMSRGELKNLPVTFFKGEMVIQPPIEKEMIIPVGKAVPFMVIFKKDLSRQAKEFKVEIVEAPSL